MTLVETRIIKNKFLYFFLLENQYLTNDQVNVVLDKGREIKRTDFLQIETMDMEPTSESKQDVEDQDITPNDTKDSSLKETSTEGRF